MTPECKQTTIPNAPGTITTWKVGPPVCTPIACNIPTLPIGARFIDHTNYEHDTFRIKPVDNTALRNIGAPADYGVSSSTSFHFANSNLENGEGSSTRTASWGWMFLAQCRADGGWLHEKDPRHNPYFPSTPCTGDSSMTWMATRAGFPASTPAGYVGTHLNGEYTRHVNWDNFFTKSYQDFGCSGGYDHLPGHILACIQHQHRDWITPVTPPSGSPYGGAVHRCHAAGGGGGKLSDFQEYPRTAGITYTIIV